MSDFRRALAFENMEQTNERSYQLSTSAIEARPGGPIWSTPKRGGDENIPPDFQVSIINSNCSPTRSLSSASVVKKSTSTNSKKIFGGLRSKSYLYFGFVPIGDSHLIDQKLTNHSGEQLRIKCSLRSTSSGIFKIQNVSSELIPPNSEFIISIRYTPEKLEENSNILIIERLNGAYAKYSFKLNGYGGRADLQMAESTFLNLTPSGLIVLTPDFFPPPPSPLPKFYFELMNKGDRSSFVLIVAVNKDDETPDDSVYINPQRFVLSSKKNDSIKKIGIKFNDRKDDRLRRESAFSLASSATPLVDNCGFRLKIIWGEETQRQRLKNWKNTYNEHFIIHDQDFTEPFLGEEKSVMPQLDRPPEAENIEFKNSLRCIHINVVNNSVLKLNASAILSIPNQF